MPRRQPANRDRRRAAGEERERRMRNYERAAAAYEDETLRRALGPLGLRGLLGEVGVPATAEAVNAHPLIQECYPLVLEVRFSGKSHPPPSAWEKPLPALHRMVFEFPDTLLHRWCVDAKSYRPEMWARGLAVVFPYDGVSLVLHNRPDLTEGPPLVNRRRPNGCVLQVHYFEPFTDDV